MPPTPDELDSGHAAVPEAGRGRTPAAPVAGSAPPGSSHRIAWSVLSALTVLLVSAGIGVLWPSLRMAGMAVALGMVFAIVVLSAAPLLLLRSVLRQTAGSRPPSSEEGVHSEPGGDK